MVKDITFKEKILTMSKDTKRMAKKTKLWPGSSMAWKPLKPPPGGLENFRRETGTPWKYL